MVAELRRPVGARTTLLATALLIAGCGVSTETTPVIGISVGTALGAVTEFNPANVEADGDVLVRLSFTNQSTLPHNLVFVGAITARTTDIVNPGVTESLEFTAPGVGTYRFVCTIHEQMQGTLTVR
jgi:plastocyanin